jgi:hypothetical protein
MYHKISEPISVMGSVLKEAVTKQTILQKLDKLTPGERKQLGDIVKKYTLQDVKKMTKMSSDVTAKLGPKLLGALGLLLALAAAAGAQPPQFGKALMDTTKGIDEIVAPLLDKADMTQLSLKMAPIQEQLDQQNEGAYKVDPTVGPSKAPTKAPSKIPPRAPGFTA